ncbi:MAG: class I SAM-dependent methyltransferase [Alphaproteobacteria bacterium]
MSERPHGSFDYTALIGIPEVALRLEMLRDRMLARLAPGPAARILEVGAGSGDATLMLAAAFRSVTLVDADPGICREVSARMQAETVGNVAVATEWVERFADASGFDGIVLQNILEHLEDPVGALRHLATMLRPGGAMFVNVPLAHSLHRWLGVEMGYMADPAALADSDIAYGHYRVYTASLLREHIEAAGLIVELERPYYLKPLTTGQLTPLPLELHRALFRLGERFPDFASYIYAEAAPAG